MDVQRSSSASSAKRPAEYFALDEVNDALVRMTRFDAVGFQVIARST